MSKARNQKSNQKQVTKTCNKSSAKSNENENQEGQLDEAQMLKDTFDDELQWCVNKLSCGLQTKGATDKSKQEAVKVMSVLTSQSAPLVKKRALMRSTFGDYRKKMAAERNSHEKEFLKGLTVVSDEHSQTTSTFLKKVHEPNKSSSERNEFKFNFDDES